MAWDNLTGNQPVSGNNLINAGSIFSLKPGQSIPATNECLTRDEAFSLLNIEPISGNKLVLKNQLIPKPVYTNIGAPQNAFMICNNENYIFISDPSNHRVIRYPIAGGSGVVIAGTGIAGAGSYQLNSPLGIDIINDYLLIADSQNHRIVYCSANGTPGSNPLYDQYVWPSSNLQFPVHVSGQIFSSSTGLTNYLVASTIDNYNQVYTVSGTLNHTVYNLTSSSANSYSISAANTPSRQFVQFTDLDNYRLVFLANSTGIPIALRRAVPNTQSGDQNPLGFNTTVNAFLWVPFTVGTGAKKVISITSDGILSVLTNIGSYNVEKNAALPSWMTKVKGMSAVRYPSADVNGNPRRPIFILSDNRVGKWMNDIFSEISIGQEPDFFLVTSQAVANVSSSADVCTMSITGDIALYTTNASAQLAVGDTAYYYAEEAYYPVNSAPHFYSYLEAGLRIWIYIESGGAVSLKGGCGGVKNFSLYQSARRLILSAEDGAISNTLTLSVDYFLTDVNGDNIGSGNNFLSLSPGTTSANSTNITGNPGDTINITNIYFSPANSGGFTLYVNGFTGNDGIE